MATKAVPVAQIQKGRLPRLFSATVAVLAAIAAFVGFARTYYLKELFGTRPLPVLVHIHGLVMTCWLVLLIAQTVLVVRHRTDIHRRLGVFGGVLASMIVVIGTAVAIHAVRAGHAPPRMSPLSFLIIPLGDITLFGIFVAAALYYRRRPELHKRCMIVATIAILPAALARWPWPLIAHQPLHFFAATDVLLIGIIAFDYARTRRLSPAYLWAGLVLIASHPLRLMLADTKAWQTFAHWITGI